jgi:hypothetical protein
MDRDYFKEKKTGKKSKGRYTVCCNHDKDRHILRKTKPEEWKLIENHCEDHLIRYSSTKDIKPICCKVCGRLIEYICTLYTESFKDYKGNE